MKIALFGREFNPGYFPAINELVATLEEKATSFVIYESFYQFIAGHIHFSSPVSTFTSRQQLEADTFCMISIGGDGTLLDTITLLQDTGIPVLGINTGRLGFLSAVSTDEVQTAARALLSGDYSIEQRTLVKLVSPPDLFGPFNYALNELTVLKRDTSTMITINAYVNDLFLNTYWADGLIIATPTGSTGYSLSCGGPIISPESRDLIITPVATHNLTVRPIVIPDDSTVKLRISGRTQDYLVVLDSRSKPIAHSVELIVRRADFCINLIAIGKRDFYKTIRNKLTWGHDKRN